MQLVLTPEAFGPRETLRLNISPSMTDDDFFDFCQANPDVRFERTAQGEIVIVPPAGFESDGRNADVVAQLINWARDDGRGHVSGPSAAFVLRTGATLSPAAAWISNVELRKAPKEKLKKFPPLAPEFVIEVRSPSDRLNALQRKMGDWLAGGVQLAWLIDGDRRTVYVYRAGQAGAVKHVGIPKLAGEGPVSGFVLDLSRIWQGV
jgi:Uma2 family endonuclease